MDCSSLPDVLGDATGDIKSTYIYRFNYEEVDFISKGITIISVLSPVLDFSYNNRIFLYTCLNN